MADLESSLRTLALQNASVSSAFGTRFFWNKIPDSVTYPVVRAQTITDTAEDTHSNTWGGRAVVQLDVFDDDKAGANTNAEIIRGWLHRYKGALGSSYNATIKVRNVSSLYDDESRLFRRLMEVDVLYFTNV
jgi:hypothetical protein